MESSAVCLEEAAFKNFIDLLAWSACPPSLPFAVGSSNASASKRVRALSLHARICPIEERRSRFPTSRPALLHILFYAQVGAERAGRQAVALCTSPAPPASGLCRSKGLGAAGGRLMPDWGQSPTRHPRWPCPCEAAPARVASVASAGRGWLFGVFTFSGSLFISISKTDDTGACCSKGKSAGRSPVCKNCTQSVQGGPKP